MTNLPHELRTYLGGELGNRAADEIERKQSTVDYLVSKLLEAEGKVIEYRELLDGYHTMVQQTVQVHADCQPFTIETVSQWLETQGLTAVSKADAERVERCKTTCAALDKPDAGPLDWIERNEPRTTEEACRINTSDKESLTVQPAPVPPEPATVGELPEPDYKSMFHDAIRSLARIDEALGLGDDGIADPDETLFAIDVLKDRANRGDSLALTVMADTVSDDRTAPDAAALVEAVREYQDAQDALDNREYMGINAEPYEVLMRRKHAARNDLDAAIHAFDQQTGGV